MTADPGPLRLPHAFALAIALAIGCASSPRPEAPGPSAPSVPRGWEIPRLAGGGRAVYALPELATLAGELRRQMAGLATDRPVRVAFYYFSLGGNRHYLGESIAQDLATEMVRGGGDRLEVYTRRRLTRVLEEQRFQASPLVDAQTLVDCGRLSGVDAIVSGTIVHHQGRDLALNCQVLDVASGKILGGKRITIPLGNVQTREPPGTVDGAAVASAADLGSHMPAGTWRVAVYDITRYREPSSLGTEVAEAIGTEMSLLGRPDLTPLTRSALEQVIEEQALQASALVDEEARVETARLAGANAILTGWEETFQDLRKVNCQLIDVESARILTGRVFLLRP